MKKISIALLVFVLAACGNNNKTENKSATDTTTNNTTGVENVNGNLPDTTNTITIDGGTPKKTTPGDTL